MSGDSGEPRVLVIGFDPYRVPGPWDPRPVAEKLEAGRARFADAGLPVRFCLLGPDTDDAGTGTGTGTDDTVTDALRGGRWEVVVIGGGLRHSDEHLDLFERVVNLVRRYAPDAAIAFNATPDTTYEAATRWLDRGRSSI